MNNLSPNEVNGLFQMNSFANGGTGYIDESGIPMVIESTHLNETLLYNNHPWLDCDILETILAYAQNQLVYEASQTDIRRFMLNGFLGYHLGLSSFNATDDFKHYIEDLVLLLELRGVRKYLKPPEAYDEPLSFTIFLEDNIKYFNRLIAGYLIYKTSFGRQYLPVHLPKEAREVINAARLYEEFFTKYSRYKKPYEFINVLGIL